MSSNPEAYVDLRSLEGVTIANRFRLDRFLAEGCFGGVFQASFLAYGTVLRSVAVKVSKRPMQESEARTAFADALLMARVADAADDPAIRDRFVTVYDAGLCPPDGPLAGHPFLAMELVSGTTLANRIRSAPLPLTNAIHCFNQLLRAVAFMHKPIERPMGGRRPVIHRDIKPENILLTPGPDGRDLLKLTDFGCAFELDRMLQWTQSAGDLAYLAPESFANEANSTQSDVYMLGLTLYEMLSGRNPFRSIGAHLSREELKNPITLRHLHLDARRQETFAGLTSHPELAAKPAISRFIGQALSVDVENRPWRDAGEMLAGWTSALNDETTPPIQTAPPWEIVRQLLSRSRQSKEIAQDSESERYLFEAQALNRDANQVPDHLLVGDAYMLHVKLLLKHGHNDEARRVAAEGYRRKKTRSTCQAMAVLYSSIGNSNLARQFENEANRYSPDP